MEGNCYYLALALHRITGWPLYVLGGYEDEHVRDEWRKIGFFHVLCKHPSGAMVDINGAISPEQWLEEWPDCELLTVTEEQLIHLLADWKKPTKEQMTQATITVKSFLMKKYGDLFNS